MKFPLESGQSTRPTTSESRKSLLGRWVQRRRRRDDAIPTDYIVQSSDFGIRVADPRKKIDRVEMLVTRLYGQRGYKIDAPSTSENAESAHLRKVTLEACRENRTVGTITVSLDGPDGLNAEDLYREEITPFRSREHRLCEFTRLALDIEQCGKEALGHLFHLAVIVSHRIHRATDLFIEVNPRHALFYRRKLGFNVIGQQKVCRRVEAPAVLLHQQLAYISEQIVRYGGLKTRDNKSFYSFFMPPWQERELIEEISDKLSRTQLHSANRTASPAG